MGSSHSKEMTPDMAPLYAATREVPSIPELLKQAQVDKSTGTLKWEEHPWMNGFWEALQEYASTHSCKEYLVYAANTVKAQRSYAVIKRSPHLRGLPSNQWDDTIYHPDFEEKELQAAWGDFKELMKKIYEENIQEGGTYFINIIGLEHKLFMVGSEYNFDAFWALHRDDPNEAPWSIFESNAINFFARTSKRTFIDSAAFKDWEADKSATGFDAFMRHKLTGLATKKGTPEKELDEKARKEHAKALEIFTEKGIVDYNVYRHVMQKGSDGWEIWQRGDEREIRILELGKGKEGIRAYDAWKKGALKKWFVDNKWNDPEYPEKTAFEAWEKSDVNYKDFLNLKNVPFYTARESLGVYKYGKKGVKAYNTGTKEGARVIYMTTRKRATEDQKEGVGILAFAAYKTAYDGCKKKLLGKCSITEREQAGDNALRRWKGTYEASREASAHVEHQNIINIMRHKKHSYAVDYASVPVDYASIPVDYASIPYDESLIINKGYHASITESDVMLTALAVMMVLIVCCICWMWSALLGYYCGSVERKKRLHEEDEVENDHDVERQYNNY